MKKIGLKMGLSIVMIALSTLSPAFAQNFCGIGVYRSHQNLNWHIQFFSSMNSRPQIEYEVAQFQGLDPVYGELYGLHGWDYNQDGYVVVAYYMTRQNQMIFSFGKGTYLQGAISDAVYNMFDKGWGWDLERGRFPGSDHHLHFKWAWSGRAPGASSNDVWNGLRGQVSSQPPQNFQTAGQTGSASCWVINPIVDDPTPPPKPDPQQPEWNIPNLQGTWLNNTKRGGEEVTYRVLIKGDALQDKYQGFFLMSDGTYDPNKPDFLLNKQPAKYERDLQGNFYTVHYGEMKMPYRPFTRYNSAEFEVFKDFIHIRVQAVGGSSYDLLRWR